MKFNKLKHKVSAAILLVLVFYTGCSPQTFESSQSSLSDNADPNAPGGANNPNGNNPQGNPSNPNNPGGTPVAGKVTSASVPTAEGIVARIQNCLGGSVSSLAGNFALALAKVKDNLPKVSDPMKATGYDQAQLLIYAACTDLTTGGTPIMQSKYAVTTAGTVAANQANLVKAGMTMLDACSAGLASGGAAAADINTALNTLVSQSASVAANTSKIAFMSVCIAANSAGVLMLGQ